MRKLLAALVLVVLVVLGARLLWPASPPAAPAEPAPQAVAQPAAQLAEPSRLDDGEQAERARRLRDGAARRDAMHRRITEALAARQAAAAASPAPAATPEGADGPASRSRRGAPAAEAEPGALADRTGNHAYLSRVLNQEFIPLVDECHALAREQHPELAGMLVLDLEILGDEDIGGVVNAIDPGQGNQIVEPALLECVRESLLATTLPPPAQGGRDAISLSIPFDPPAAE